MPQLPRQMVCSWRRPHHHLLRRNIREITLDHEVCGVHRGADCFFGIHSWLRELSVRISTFDWIVAQRARRSVKSLEKSAQELLGELRSFAVECPRLSR